MSKSLFFNKRLIFFSVYLYNDLGHLSFISSIFLGFQKGYFYYLKLKGMGYRFLIRNNNVILKIGFSHRVIYVISADTACRFISRYTIIAYQTIIKLLIYVP